MQKPQIMLICECTSIGTEVWCDIWFIVLSRVQRNNVMHILGPCLHLGRGGGSFPHPLSAQQRTIIVEWLEDGRLLQHHWRGVGSHNPRGVSRPNMCTAVRRTIYLDCT